MSGHSKWAKVHRQKTVTDAKKGTQFTKLGNAITVAAKLGGGDLEMNFRLKLAIEKAKDANMPRDNIERAIMRGTGELEGKNIEQALYEGFGPGGSVFLVDCLTDNKHRTSSQLKHIFSEHGGNLGAPNSVLWQFENKGLLGIETLDDTLELELIDEGVEDIEKINHTYTLYCQPQNLEKIKNFLEKKNISIAFAEVEMVAKNRMKVTDTRVRETIERLIHELENNEDVNNYFTNADI